MGAPERIGDRSGRQIAVDAGDGRRHAAERGAPPDTRHLRGAVAHPHSARSVRTLHDVDMIKRTVTEEDDDGGPL